MNTYLNIAKFVSYFSVLAPLAIYLVKFSSVKKQIHSVGLLVIISAICDLIVFILVRQKLPTAFVANAFFLFQFFFLSHYYYKTVFLNKPKTVLVITLVQYILGLLIVTLFYNAFREQHQNYMWAISSAVLIVYSVLCFKNIVNTYHSTHIYSLGDFWINSAVFLYLTLSLGLFAIRTDAIVVQLDREMYKLLWSFYNVNNVLKNTLFAIGIFYSIKKTVEVDPYLSN